MCHNSVLWQHCSSWWPGVTCHQRICYWLGCLIYELLSWQMWIREVSCENNCRCPKILKWNCFCFVFSMKGDVNVILNVLISNWIWWLIIWDLPLILPSCEYQRTWLIVVNIGLVIAWCHQATTMAWTIVDPNPWQFGLVLLGHNGITQHFCN